MSIRFLRSLRKTRRGSLFLGFYRVACLLENTGGEPAISVLETSMQAHGGRCLRLNGNGSQLGQGLGAPSGRSNIGSHNQIRVRPCVTAMPVTGCRVTWLS